MPKNLVKYVPDLKAERQNIRNLYYVNFLQGKNRENITMLHYLAGDNFDLTRKVVEFFTLKILT